MSWGPGGPIQFVLHLFLVVFENRKYTRTEHERPNGYYRIFRAIVEQ